MTSAERAADKRLRDIYKKSLEQKKKEIAAQGGKCAICNRPASDFTLYQDHDHRCCPRRLKKFCGKCNRGFLCFLCNKYVVGVLERAAAAKVYPIPPQKLIEYFEHWNQVLKENGAYAKKEEATRVRKKQTRVRRRHAGVSK